jgi:hypothetical protein
MLPPIYTTLQASTAVVALVGTRVYRHGRAPQNVGKPYVTWTLIAGVPENQLSGLPPMDRQTVQIDCWHPTDEGCEALATAVRDAIEPYAHMTGAPIDQRETDTKLWRMALQIDWWMARPFPEPTV